MNMIIPTATLATPNGTTRPQVRIVIVGHVDHGKSTLVGRLLHETGSLPEGKLEMLKAVSARRGMPFEWSFLLDALQTERDQGITIDTTQISFRTRSRDVVLIDAPGHAEFLRNMITGASQADGAVLIIDALEGVRDQTRRHGYLLHLLGVKQVAVVVNKMDRVDFSADRFKEISDEISAHLIGLGVTPSAVIPISARDGDGVAERTPRIEWYDGPTVVEALDALEPARPLQTLALRLPVQAIYKFDDRRIVAGRIESGSLAAGDEIVIMPAGKIARIKTVESWPATPVQGSQGAGRAVGITLDRELFVERGDVIAHVGSTPRDTRRIRARIFWLHDKPLVEGASILVRLGTRETRATVVAIEKAVDPGELSSVETKAIARNHVGEIDISLAQPIAADPYTDNSRTGRLVIEVNGRIAGGGLVLSVDAGQRAIPVDIVPVESALRPDERSARYRHNGAVVWLTGLPGSGKSTLARALERRLFSAGGSPVLLDGDTLRAGLNSDLGFSAQDRSENIRRLAEVAVHLARNGHIAIVAAVSPAREDRAAARRIADTAFREIYVATPVEVCENRDPKGHYAKARAGALHGFTGTGNELVTPGGPRAASQLFDSNRFMLTAMLARLGCEVGDLGIIRDDRAAMADGLKKVADAHDLILTTGGVSTGDEDHVKASVESAGTLVLWRMAIKPGRPVAMGIIGGTPLIGLPGNPVASFVTFVHVVRPTVLALMGASQQPLLPMPVRSAFAYKKKIGRREYVRVTLRKGDGGVLEVIKFPREGAGLLSSLVDTDGLVELGEEITQVEPGQIVGFLSYASLM